MLECPRPLTCKDGEEALKDVKWEKPSEEVKLDWMNCKKFAESKGGRLMTLEEVREFIMNKHNNEAIYPGEDSWVAVFRPENPELHDFVQIGSGGHATGISHTDNFGVPNWADDETP